MSLTSWPPAPLSDDEIAGVVRPFGESTMLPARAYTSPEVLGWERRQLFAGTWSCVGRIDELATQYATMVGDVPVLITRESDRVAAFANTCRHRGHEVLPDGEGSQWRVVVCPYHAWVYTLDGRLKTAPRFRDVPGFANSEH